MHASPGLRLIGALLSLAALLALLAPLSAASAAPKPPAAGQPDVALLPPIAEQGSADFAVSPDGKTVVYQLYGPGVPGTFYSVPADGSAAPKMIAQAPSIYLGVWLIVVDRMLFTVGGPGASSWSLFSVPLDGSSAPILLADNLLGAVAPNVVPVAGGRIVYQVRRDTPDGSAVQLLSSALDGGLPTVVLFTGGSGSFQWAVSGGDSSRVIYAYGVARPDEAGLFAVSVAGPASSRVRLTPAGLLAGVFDLSDDGRVAAFPFEGRLYTVPTDASAPPRAVSAPIAPTEQLFTFVLSPDGSTVAYGVGTLQPVDGSSLRGHIYSAPSDGAAPAVRLSRSPIGIGSFFGPFLRLEISPDSRSLAYVGLDQAGVFVATLGVAESARTLPGGSPGFDFRFLDSQRLLVVSPALVVAPLDPAMPPVRLSPPGIEIRSGPVLVAGRALFWGCPTSPCQVSDGITLFSVPLAGPATAALRLATVYRDYSTLLALPAADGRVVYAADTDERIGTEIYSVPVEQVGVGFAANQATLEEGDPGRFQVSLDRPAERPVSVSYQVDGLDVTLRGNLSFAPGVITQTIDLQLAADGRFTGDRHVRVALVDTEGAAPLLYNELNLLLRDAEALRLWLPLAGRLTP